MKKRSTELAAAAKRAAITARHCRDLARLYQRQAEEVSALARFAAANSRLHERDAAELRRLVDEAKEAEKLAGGDDDNH